MITQAQTMMIFNPIAFFWDNTSGEENNFSFNGWNLSKKLITQSIQNTLTGILNDYIKPGSKEAMTLIAQTAGDMLLDYGISEDNLDHYRFKLNPNSLNVSSAKIRTEKFTGNGWDIDTRGETMKVYQYSGSTGSLMPELKNNSSAIRHIEILTKNLRNILSPKGTNPKGQVVGGTNVNVALSSFVSYYDYKNLDIDRILSNPKLSTSYVKFLLFKEFWKWNPGDLIVIWEDDAYIGKFKNFNFRLDADNPYKIVYDFDLIVYPDFIYNMQTGYLDDNAMNEIFKKFVKAVPTKGIKENKESTAQNTFLESIGNYLYNKNRIQFYNTAVDHSLSNLTPKELASRYAMTSNIDILGESFPYEFNLKPANETVTKDNSSSNFDNLLDGRKESQTILTPTVRYYG